MAGPQPYSGGYNPAVQGGAVNTANNGGSSLLTGGGVSTTASYGTNTSYTYPTATKHHVQFRQDANWVAGTDAQNNTASAQTYYADVAGV